MSLDVGLFKRSDNRVIHIIDLGVGKMLAQEHHVWKGDGSQKTSGILIGKYVHEKTSSSAATGNDSFDRCIALTD